MLRRLLRMKDEAENAIFAHIFENNEFDSDRKYFSGLLVSFVLRLRDF